MKFGRPDSEFLKWRWKPTDCELPPFDAAQFLELVKGKSMAFVGDSLARNHMQSLLCLLATVEHPTQVSYNTTDAKFKRWLYPNYNFTLSSFWSPYLVKAQAMEEDPKGPAHKRLMNLYLDQADTAWTAQIEPFDYVIISAARWFFGPHILYENRSLVGCHYCLKNDIKNLTMSYSYKRAFRTAFKALLGLENFKGEVVLRTLSPAHFENGEWNKGGECKRTEPVLGTEMKLSGFEVELYLGQIEELRVVEREGKKRGLKFRLMDISEAMVVRPDGHPNHFGHWPRENVTIADCVHWCLPGPIDTWNEFLLQMLKHD
ncbi:Trichome birefringence-like family [Trema orientale]|uniref:Trichome birefringence-like family n=1 Tax=Trema orientale TaxID=63057 RepID=A0A2P5F6Y3_TREOI|nr:Trichome birefringence-like family [Trema orientale]